MAETDVKRTKFKDLLDYIKSRLLELEEEKEELKEFQGKKKNEDVWNTHCISGNSKKLAKL
jgi:hypothetical protein